MTWYEHADRIGCRAIVPLGGVALITVLSLGLSAPITLITVGLVVVVMLIWAIGSGLTHARRRAASGSR
ncbi:hypothetical protein [Microlunatus ginsengisoli]|uniref:Uncharacterized protein n=1 Tax=Microlunatus ginsengisoli TaxID=363863 RepID=A0ABP6ZWS9_9ACTN